MHRGSRHFDSRISYGRWAQKPENMRPSGVAFWVYPQCTRLQAEFREGLWESLVGGLPGMRFFPRLQLQSAQLK